MRITRRFDRFLEDRLKFRYETTRKALELYMGGNIVETGSFRSWDVGGSTVVLAMATAAAGAHGGMVYSIDINTGQQAAAAHALGPLGIFVSFLNGDSVQTLRLLQEIGGTSLLYLDSLGPGPEAQKQFPPAEGLDYQQHSLEEMKAAAPMLNEGCIVLLDDDDQSPWGKPRLTKRWLADNGFECVLEKYQSVWRKA